MCKIGIFVIYDSKWSVFGFWTSWLDKRRNLKTPLSTFGNYDEHLSKCYDILWTKHSVTSGTEHIKNQVFNVRPLRISE